jgi:hypothetical protein
VPSAVLEDFEPSGNIVARLHQLAARQNEIIDGGFGAAKTLVDTHRTADISPESGPARCAR